MHRKLKSVHLGRTKENKTKQMASKIENTEKKKVNYIDFKKQSIAAIRNYALNQVLALLRNQKSQG